ncbi:MAG: (Fe-S)-binding protein [Desulfobacteraceae bacterium]|nr:(Fe-S)-binding protein [Desulfobacteraceae bacterium]
MNRCAKCGACTAVCPLYQVSGRESLAARGKLHLMSRLDPAAASPAYAEILSGCLLCGACREVCPQGVDPPARIVAARGRLARGADRHFWRKFLANRVLARPQVLNMALGLAGAAAGVLARHLPPESGLRLRLGLITGGTGSVPRHGRYVDGAAPVAHPRIAYFVGCLADHLEPGIARATARLARLTTGAPPAVPAGQGCCGQAAAACGDFTLARTLAKRNIEAFASDGVPILTSCASCYRHLLTYPELLREDPGWHPRAAAFAARVRELATFLQGRFVPEPQTAAAVLYHDPCHLRHGVSITAEPRQLLTAAGLHLTELPGGPRCCGQGGLFHLAHPDLSAMVRDRLLAAFRPLAADLVTTTCSGCLLQWRQGLALAGSRVRVRHLAEVLAGTQE